MALEVDSHSVDCSISPKLREATSLFGALDDLQLAKLLSYTHRRELKSGDRLFSQGDLPTDIYVVCDGRIDLVIQKDGIFNIEASFQSGDSIGETALIGIQPQVGSAIVSGGNADLLVISRETLLDIYNDDMALYGVLMMNIAREVSRKLHCIMKSI